MSDVIGDDLPSIGSGPCVPDPTTAAEVRGLLEDAGLWARMPESARALVLSAEAGKTAGDAKAGRSGLSRVTLELIASNRLALEAAARRAAELGLAPAVIPTPIAGEAAVTGASLAADLLDHCASDASATSATGSAADLGWRDHREPG